MYSQPYVYVKPVTLMSSMYRHVNSDISLYGGQSSDRGLIGETVRLYKSLELMTMAIFFIRP